MSTLREEEVGVSTLREKEEGSVDTEGGGGKECRH